MVRRRRALRLGLAALAVVLVLGVAVVGGLVATGAFAEPTVSSTSSEWGAVRADTTEIRTTVVVNNPNPVGVPGVVNVAYTARLNDVTLAEGVERGVGFGRGESTLELATTMDNRRIADWWVTHVNGGERSELSLSATVSGPGFSRAVPARSSTVETDLLGGFATAGERTVSVRNESFLVVCNETATWGRADAETTPIRFAATVENVHDYDVTLDGVAYVVTMNGVTLGRGQRSAGVDVAPGETGEIDVTVALETPRMADWWREHVRDGETSDLRVEMYGVVEWDGERTRVPLRLYDRSLRLETDVLGGGESSVAPVATPDPDGPAFAVPEVAATTRTWGRVTDATTEVTTTATLRTPPQRLNDLLTLDVRQTTAINGVEAASGRARVETVRNGTTRVRLTAAMDNGAVPAWWARHLNAGERSRVVTTPTATADVGLTKFDVALGTRTGTFETDLLAGMNGDRSDSITASGRRVLTVESVSSSWGEATPATAPIEVRARVANELPTAVRVSDVRYRVTLSDVVLADRTAPGTYRVPGGETATLPLTMELDNGQMDEWWPTHVRNGERSRLNVTVVATADSSLGSVRRPVEALGQSSVVETDVLNATGD